MSKEKPSNLQESWDNLSEEEKLETTKETLEAEMKAEGIEGRPPTEGKRKETITPEEAKGKCSWCGAEASVESTFCSPEHEAIQKTWEKLPEEEKHALVSLGENKNEQEKNKKLREEARNKLLQAAENAKEEAA